MTRSAGSAAILALLALAALAGCVRQGPPAPLSFPGTETKKPPLALVPQAHLPHPDRVTVEKGDTLYLISRRYDVPLRSIIDANHLDPPFHIAAGTTLELPQERFHVVQAGDTLISVARLYNVDVSSLASLNHLSAPYGLRQGDTLYLPAPVSPASPAPVASAPVASAPVAALPVAPAPSAAAPAPPSGNAPSPSASESKAAPAVPAPTATETAVVPAVSGKGFAWPLTGQIIGSYGEGPNGTHNDGVNIAADPGAPVRAAADGTVAYAGNELRGYGNLVLIKHTNGYMTAYAHNAQLLVKRGDVVKRGQVIAKAGATGAVNAPQLHFEIRQGTHALDPVPLLPSVETSAR